MSGSIANPDWWRLATADIIDIIRRYGIAGLIGGGAAAGAASNQQQ